MMTMKNNMYYRLMNELLGKWESVYGGEKVTMEFFPDGSLEYVAYPRHTDNKQIILLTYKIEGNHLITDQPSFPKLERTEFTIVDKKLTLNFAGELTVFSKQDE